MQNNYLAITQLYSANIEATSEQITRFRHQMSEASNAFSQ